MVPLLVVGIAAAAFFFSGCSESPTKSPEKPAEPEIPPPSTPPKEPPPSESPPSSPDSPPAEDPGGSSPGEKKKLSPEEFKNLAEGLRSCMKVQAKYKFDCPPPEEMPPNCKCEVIRRIERIDPFDPKTPLRAKEILVPPVPIKNPGFPSS